MKASYWRNKSTQINKNNLNEFYYIATNQIGDFWLVIYFQFCVLANSTLLRPLDGATYQGKIDFTLTVFPVALCEQSSNLSNTTHVPYNCVPLTSLNASLLCCIKGLQRVITYIWGVLCEHGNFPSQRKRAFHQTVNPRFSGYKDMKWVSQCFPMRINKKKRKSVCTCMREKKRGGSWCVMSCVSLQMKSTGDWEGKTGILSFRGLTIDIKSC